MGLNTVEYKGNGAVNTDRGPSRVIWADCPWDDIRENPALGMAFFDDFLMSGSAGSASAAALAASQGQWATAQSQGALFSDGAAEGGVITFGSDGDQEGVTLISMAGAFRMVTTSTLALNKKLWFEARVARSSITDDKGDFFVGLCTPSLSSNLPTLVPISTTDATLSTTPSFFGFHSVDKSGVTYGSADDWSVVFNLASGTVNSVTNLTTLATTVLGAALTAGQFVKLGFIFDPDAYPKRISSATARQTAGTIRKPLIRIFINGLEAAAFLSSDDVANATAGQAFPTAFMAPCIAVMNTTSSSPPTMSADWIRVAQLANS